MNAKQIREEVMGIFDGKEQAITRPMRGERRGPPHAGAEDEDDQPAVPQAEEDEGADTRGPAAHSWGLDESEDLGPEVGDFHPLKQISSEADMGGALALLRLWRHQANVIRERMEEAIRRAEEWAAPKVARLENSAEHLERRILAYAEDHPEVFHGKKTARLPVPVVEYLDSLAAEAFVSRTDAIVACAQFAQAKGMSICPPEVAERARKAAGEVA